ncbi:hypothetical protein P0F39_002684 [Vibrio metschnikovii]|uniref:hypothetical protein n=1 Tax=unclassified Vibrio TaxID=2614977 RepID=UPI00137358EC|nr:MULTISPECIES: hypothetical protein [unclassified Vibrio]EKO3685630.1 hypothetical protein [Vibrio metschnikovii]EKO3689011.1 hypothetical protein [Vibrio metschnikovii]EKO3781127.1 hypothetical protein [Vibrio metschnikovii]EKO3888113.1 hypothetical protein [Vibrio metschnikovii]EKO3936729.1 hypothetical protein [Vibrio metschnikovii]
MKTLNIPTEKGRADVPAFFVNGVNGLCVTMVQFGSFEVTHTKSGHKVIGGFERFANAVYHMLSIYLAMQEAGIEPDSDMDLLKKQIIESEHKCKHLDRLSIKGYINIIKPIMGFSGEFPWEGDDESPHAKVEDLMKKIEGLKNENPTNP